MAVGETSGQGRKRIVSAGGGRRRPELGEPGSQLEGDVAAAETPAPAPDVAPPAAPETPDAAAPLPGAGGGDEALERLLAEEEEIERRTRDEHHDVPHFRREND
jgi:small subunit ribosomal protein S3